MMDEWIATCLPVRLRHVLHGSGAFRAEMLSPAGQPLALNNASEFTTASQASRRNKPNNVAFGDNRAGQRGTTSGSPSYIRITTDDKKVLWCKDKCVVLQMNPAKGIQEVFPNLQTAYYNIVHKQDVP